MQILELLGSSSRRLAEAAAVMVSHAGSAMRPRLAGKPQLLSLASDRLLALCKSDSLRGAKASVRQARPAADPALSLAHEACHVSGSACCQDAHDGALPAALELGIRCKDC